MDIPPQVLSDDKIKEKNDRLIDTLIIVCGFVIAGSYGSKNETYLYFIFGFLLSSILTKSVIIQSIKDKFTFILYFCISFFFPLVLIMFFYDNGAFFESDAPFVITPLFSIVLLTTFIQALEIDKTFLSCILLLVLDWGVLSLMLE